MSRPDGPRSEDEQDAAATPPSEYTAPFVTPNTETTGATVSTNRVVVVVGSTVVVVVVVVVVELVVVEVVVVEVVVVVLFVVALGRVVVVGVVVVVGGQTNTPSVPRAHPSPRTRTGSGGTSVCGSGSSPDGGSSKSVGSITDVTNGPRGILSRRSPALSKRSSSAQSAARRSGVSTNSVVVVTGVCCATTKVVPSFF
jgi:hypothetical protein